MNHFHTILQNKFLKKQINFLVFFCISVVALPLSLSRPSLQFCSSSTLQSLPSQPSAQRHSHWLSWLTRHCPWPEQLFGQPSCVQCFPFHPVTHRHVPFLHCPCSLHLHESKPVPVIKLCANTVNTFWAKTFWCNTINCDSSCNSLLLKLEDWAGTRYIQ